MSIVDTCYFAVNALVYSRNSGKQAPQHTPEQVMLRSDAQLYEEVGGTGANM